MTSSLSIDLLDPFSPQEEAQRGGFRIEDLLVPATFSMGVTLVALHKSEVIATHYEPISWICFAILGVGIGRSFRPLGPPSSTPIALSRQEILPETRREFIEELRSWKKKIQKRGVRNHVSHLFFSLQTKGAPSFLFLTQCIFWADPLLGRCCLALLVGSYLDLLGCRFNHVAKEERSTLPKGELLKQTLPPTLLAVVGIFFLVFASIPQTASSVEKLTSPITSFLLSYSILRVASIGGFLVQLSTHQFERIHFATGRIPLWIGAGYLTHEFLSPYTGSALLGMGLGVLLFNSTLQEVSSFPYRSIVIRKPFRSLTLLGKVGAVVTRQGISLTLGSICLGTLIASRGQSHIPLFISLAQFFYLFRAGMHHIGKGTLADRMILELFLLSVSFREISDTTQLIGQSIFAVCFGAMQQKLNQRSPAYGLYFYEKEMEG